MKHIYDMVALMHRTGITDYVELQKQGYDVIFYLKEKQKILQSQVEKLQQEIDLIECHSKEKEETNITFDSFLSAYLLNSVNNSHVDDSTDYNDSSCDDDFGPNMGFDESRIGEPDYCYIGT